MNLVGAAAFSGSTLYQKNLKLIIHCNCNFQERAQVRLSQIRSSSSRKSPEVSEVPVAMLTPPKTDEKARMVVEYSG